MTAECTILMLNSGRRIELLRAFRRAFEDLGIAGRIVCTDINEFAPSLYLADACYRLPRSVEDGFLSELLDVCARERVSLIVPSIDPDLPVLARERDKLMANGARALISPPQAIGICRDKLETFRFLAANGFSTPETLGIERARDAGLPLFIKPRCGSASDHVFKVNSREELEFFWRYVPDPMIQPFVAGEEITVDVFSDWNAKPLGAVPRRRIRVRAGEVIVSRVERRPLLEALCMRLAQCLGACGPINVQAIVGNDVCWITEINARFGGGCPLSMAAGAPLAQWTVLLALNRDPACEPMQLQAGLTMMRFDDAIMRRAEEMLR